MINMSTHMAPFQHCFKRVRMFERRPCLKIRYELLGLQLYIQQQLYVVLQFNRNCSDSWCRCRHAASHIYLAARVFWWGSKEKMGTVAYVAWRCVVRDIETPIVSISLATQRNATQRAAVMEVSLNTNTNQQT